jgi:hypothetical protein
VIVFTVKTQATHVVEEEDHLLDVIARQPTQRLQLSCDDLLVNALKHGDQRGQGGHRDLEEGLWCSSDKQKQCCQGQACSSQGWNRLLAERLQHSTIGNDDVTVRLPLITYTLRLQHVEQCAQSGHWE